MIYVASGVSMRPLIRAGRPVEVLPAAFSEIHLGDCVAYRVDGPQVFLHRVLWKTSKGLWVKGDNDVTGLHFVPLAAVEGKGSAGFLSRGAPGLVWGLFSNAACLLRRFIRPS